MSRFTAKSYIEQNNRTRGQYGVKPVMYRVSWDPEANTWYKDSHGECWGAFDPDWGWQAPWPEEDVVMEDDED